MRRMKKTLNIDDALIKEAKLACAATTDTDTVRLGLEALVRHAAYERLRALRGSERRVREYPAPYDSRAEVQTPGCLMVLVDTSVWIRFLADRAPYARELDRLLANDEVTGHELVYGELLLGDRSGRKKLLAAYERMEQATVVPNREVVAFVHARDLHGRGVAWIDIQLLASAIVGRLELWTADPRFATLAQQLGVAYDPTAS